MKKYITYGIAAGILSLTIFATGALANNDGQGDHENNNEMGANVWQLVHNTGSTLEVHISDNGKVLVRGAKVTAVSGSTINASSTFESGASISWVVTSNTNNLKTEFIDRDSRSTPLSQIKVGDYISFAGMMNNSGSPFTVNASIIKDWSLKINQDLLAKRVFEGKLQAISGGGLPATLTLIIDQKTFTVNVPTGISIINKDWAQISLSSFQVGDIVRIYGAIEAVNTSVVDATVVRNASR